MKAITVAQVLEHARRFEEMLADYYRRLSEQTAREGVRLLTDYMSRHRKRMGEALRGLDPQETERIRSVLLLYDPQVADCRCFEGFDMPADATAARVLDVAVWFDNCLVRLYRQAAAQAEDPRVRELFESLIRLEERDQIELKKIRAMDYF